MSNNEAEFMAAYQGLKIAIRNGYRKLEIEGDSTLVIDTIKKLIQGKRWEQVVKSWRTTSIVQEIEETLKKNEYKIISHVKREGNKPADCLANWGSKEIKGKVDDSWTNQMAMTRWDNLKQLIDNDTHETT